MKRMCEFCEKFDFATATTEISEDFAYINLAICNTRFSKEEQFNFCPVCGRDMRKEDEGEIEYLNVSVQVSNYATSALNETLNHYGELGFKLVNVVLAQNKHNCEVMYLFFTKENHPTEKGI